MKNINETKKEKFIRIAEARTNKIIDMIKLLGNCSNRNIYDFDKEDVKIIFSTIEEELKLAKAKFEMANTSEKKFKIR